MAQHEDKFEEEFSNWAKTVLGLKEARDGSIKFIKRQTESFAQRLDNMHGPHEGEHFKELMMKVTVRGEVNKLHSPKTKSTLNESHSKDLPTIKWVLKDNSCVTCGKIFEEQLDNFEYSWCNCKKWIKSSTEDQIKPSFYWWVLAKMYSANSEIVDAVGPEEVEPLAIFNLIKHCKLFDLKLRLKVDTLVKLRHKLMHSANDRLTRQKMNESFDLIKQFLKEVEAETIDEVEKLETSTLVLYDENGEYSKQIKEALQQQDKSLNADFKSPEGIRGATIKSLAASKLAIKEERKKSAECEKKHITKYEELLKEKEEIERRTKQYQIDALELKLQLETKKNETHADNCNELKSHIDALELKLQHEIKKNETHMDNFTQLKNNVDTLDSKLQHEIKKNEAHEDKFTEQKNIIDALELNLQHEIKKNETHEETFTKLKNNIDELKAKYQRELENDTRQEDKLTELMSNINALALKVHSETKKNEDKFTELKNKMENVTKDLTHNRNVRVVRSSPKRTLGEIMKHFNSDVQDMVKYSSKSQFEEAIVRDIKSLDPPLSPGILLLGPVGAGKSSFINSCSSVGVGRKRALAQTGSDEGSYTLEFKKYRRSYLLKNFRFMDCMGIEETIGRGLHPDDIKFLLQGHIKRNYRFNEYRPMDKESEYYEPNPKFEKTTQCVVFVIDAITMNDGIPPTCVGQIKWLQRLQREIKKADVPQVLVLTKCDLLCREVKEDANNIFKSAKVERAVETASAVFAIDKGSIHPVINYDVRVELSTAMNIPILLALRQLLQYACAYAEYVLTDSDKE